MELLQWYNLVFLAPIGLAGIYLILSATGLGSGDGADADADADLDHDLDLGADHDFDVGADHDVDIGADHDFDVGADHDVDIGADADADVDHDLAADHDVHVDHHLAPHGVEHAVMHDQPLVLRALSVLGFGKVPVSILITCLAVIFGATGLVANGLFGSVLPWNWAPTLYFWPSLGIATVAAFSLTGAFARGLHRVMPTSETYAIRPEDLVGRVGVAVYPLRAGERGVVSVRDDGGTVHQVAARPVDGDIGRDADVILVRYHRQGDYYDVSVSPL